MEERGSNGLGSAGGAEVYVHRSGVLFLTLSLLFASRSVLTQSLLLEEAILVVGEARSVLPSPFLLPSFLFLLLRCISGARFFPTPSSDEGEAVLRAYEGPSDFCPCNLLFNGGLQLLLALLLLLPLCLCVSP